MSVLLGEMCDEWACKKRAGMGDLLVANLLQSPRERHGFYPSVFLPLKSEFLTNLDTKSTCRNASMFRERPQTETTKV